MKLTHEILEAPINFQEGFIPVLVVENPHQFTKMISSLYNQANGFEGDFILSNEGKVQDISKTMELLIDIFSVEINNKKIISKLYAYLKSVTLENNYVETSALFSTIHQYLASIGDYTNYPLVFDYETDLAVLFKAMNLRLDLSSDSISEKLADYISVLSEFSEVKCLVLVNLKSYFTEEELLSLYEHALYAKLHLILIENKMAERQLQYEQLHLIDMDLCEIL